MEYNLYVQVESFHRRTWIL